MAALYKVFKQKYLIIITCFFLNVLTIKYTIQDVLKIIIISGVQYLSVFNISNFIFPH